MATPTPDIAMATASELRVLLGKLKRRLREESGSHGLSWPQVSVLGHLERDGSKTVTELAELEGVRQQSMGATVASLETAGLLKGTPHPTDGRRTILSLTPKARAWVKASRAAREDWLFHTIQTRLSPTEQKKLAGAVELLKRLVEP
ncbi:MarR family winged helix-turn-helix transcriptional regulator [Dyella sp.]|uniref:MarR family winged helix-turn-helix transcriptional regulator n=1 Tax=Dyella sp. TaxID=1869338 RepID=UPI002B4703B7|nr:MarR family transcriptional regulator [Dyella sp.]HKT28603.1 MarR family transcriptional regulator [Dyella sp.]